MLGSGGAASAAQLFWTTTSATSASIDNGVGALSANPSGTTSGTATVSVTADTVFTLTVTDGAGASATYPWTVRAHAYRLAPCITGDPTITVSGKALLSRCDAPESVTSITPATGPAQYFHTSMVGGPVRMFPVVAIAANDSYNYPGSTLQHPYVVHGVSAQRGNALTPQYPARYTDYSGPYYATSTSLAINPRYLIGYYNASGKGTGQVLKDESGWLLTSPPTPFHPAAVPGETTLDQYPVSDGDSVYAVGTNTDGSPRNYYPQATGGYGWQVATYGGGSTGYAAHLGVWQSGTTTSTIITQDYTYNNAGMQQGCPYVTMNTSAAQLSLSQGVYAYYCQATDSMGAYQTATYLNNYNQYATSSSGRRYLYLGGGSGGKYSDLTRAPNGVGGPGAHLRDCNKVLEARLVVVTPGGQRSINSIYAFDGQLLCITPIYVSPTSSAEVFDPVAFSGALPVLTPLINYDFGDATFALTFPVRTTLSGTFVGTAGAQSVPGAAVDVRAFFTGTNPDGTAVTAGSYYSQFSGTSAADGTFTDGAGDYWMGFTGPGVAAVSAWQVIITLPSTTLASGSVLHAETLTVNLSTANAGFKSGTYYAASVSVSEVTQPPVVSGSWTCTSPSATLFNITIRQLPLPQYAGQSLTQDAHRRPVTCSGGAGNTSAAITGYVSKDAGHTYLTTTLDAAGTDASLLIDPRRNRFRVIYSKSSALVQVAGEMQEGYVLDAGGPVALAGMGGGAAPTGAYPVAVPHPADKDFTLLAYLSGGALKSAGSWDGGISWGPQATIATGLDFTPTGRAALAMVGESAFIAYASGNNLYAAVGTDRGNSWAAPVLAATSGPYTGLSLLASQGRLYLLAFTGSTPAPVLLVSPDLGATWAQVTSTFPAITPPSGIGVTASTGTLRLGLTHTSSDDGHTWTAA